jgi:hypothetical protein
MNYEVRGEGGKIAGQLNHLAHPTNVLDPDLQDFFVEMVAKGITVLSAPDKKPPEGIYADNATTTRYADATPEQIISELHFAGFTVVPQGASGA